MRSKRVLLYYLPNKRSVAIETICREINKTGNELIVLTQSPPGDLHAELERWGVKVYSKVFAGRFSFLNFFRHFLFLVSFCRKNKMDAVWSHLNPPSFVAVFAQYFIKARVIVFRHHFHGNIKTEGFASQNKNERMMDRVIGRRAREIVVPSLEVYNGMVEYEKIDKKKISIIPYIYDFSQYAKPDADEVKKIRAQFAARLIIIIASRMIKMKRHDLVLPVFNKLVREGYDIKVLLLDDGEERKNLEQYTMDNQLWNRIFFLGLRRNITDYLSAADLVVHPSYTEASSSLIKEAGLMTKPVIVCSGIGDFDQYIEHKRNGFLVHPPNEAAEFEEYIKYAYDCPARVKEMGEALCQTVLDNFSANPRTVDKYLSQL